MLTLCIFGNKNGAANIKINAFILIKLQFKTKITIVLATLKLAVLV